MTYKIETGHVAPPASKFGRAKTKEVETFALLEVGQSFVMPERKVSKRRINQAAWRSKRKARFVSIGLGEMRVFRVL